MRLDIKRNVPLAPYTTLNLGGPAEYFAVASSVEDMVMLAHYAREHNAPVSTLGGGSNLLVNDVGVKGLVIKNEIKSIEVEDEGTDFTIIKAGAGESWDQLVAYTTTKKLWGFENLSGIPGKVGGAIVQNINAYGVTIADMVIEVEAVHLLSGKVCHFNAAQCEFEYRDSFFKKQGPGNEYVIISAKFKLSKIKKLEASYRSSLQSVDVYLKEKGVMNPEPDDIRRAIILIRTRIGMIEGMYQSAGSFFKNPVVSEDKFNKVADIMEREYAELSNKFSPWHWQIGNNQVKISAAFLMECTSYNKTSFADKTFDSGVGISPVHTLSIINKGGATATSVKKFTQKISETINEKFGITLEPEVCFL